MGHKAILRLRDLRRPPQLRISNIVPQIPIHPQADILIRTPHPADILLRTIFNRLFIFPLRHLPVLKQSRWHRVPIFPDQFRETVAGNRCVQLSNHHALQRLFIKYQQ